MSIRPQPSPFAFHEIQPARPVGWMSDFQERPLDNRTSPGAQALPPASNFPENVLGRIGLIHSTIAASLTELRQLSSRNHGPAPETATNGADASKPYGRHHEVYQAIDALEADVGELFNIASRLNNSH